MFGIILLAIGLLFSWGMTYLTLRKKGCNWFMVSGYLTLPKKEKVKYKAKFDVVAMNRYSGKFMYFPMSVMLTLMMPVVLELPWGLSTWYGTTLAILSILVVISCFKALWGIIGDRFEKKGETR